jgi:hypothetical protein
MANAIMRQLFLSPEIISYGLFSFGVVGFFPCREAAIAARGIIIGATRVWTTALLLVFHQPTKTLLFGGRTAPTGIGAIAAFCCCQCPPSAGACASLRSTFSCKGSD